jgi:hypothetical protein
VADSGIAGGTYAVRATRAGDVWEQVETGQHSHDDGGCGDACGTGSTAASGPVALGIPRCGHPARDARFISRTRDSRSHCGGQVRCQPCGGPHARTARRGRGHQR